MIRDHTWQNIFSIFKNGIHNKSLHILLTFLCEWHAILKFTPCLGTNSLFLDGSVFFIKTIRRSLKTLYK